MFGVGNDYDNATARTLGANQTMVNQWVETGLGDTYWVQRTSGSTGASGSVAADQRHRSDGDRWNMFVVEVLGASIASTTAPSAPTGVTAVAGNAAGDRLWTAPANGGSPITGYTVTPFIGAVAETPVPVTGNPPATTTSVSGLTNGTAYTFTVSATNAIGTGPASAASNSVTPVCAGEPDDHVRPAVRRNVAAVARDGVRHRVVGTRGHLLVADVRGVHDRRDERQDRDVGDDRALHDPGRPGGEASFNPAPSVQQSFNVTKASQTITFAALGERDARAVARRPRRRRRRRASP